MLDKEINVPASLLQTHNLPQSLVCYSREVGSSAWPEGVGKDLTFHCRASVLAFRAGGDGGGGR